MYYGYACVINGREKYQLHTGNTVSKTQYAGCVVAHNLSRAHFSTMINTDIVVWFHSLLCAVAFV